MTNREAIEIFETYDQRGIPHEKRIEAVGCALRALQLADYLAGVAGSLAGSQSMPSWAARPVTKPAGALAVAETFIRLAVAKAPIWSVELNTKAQAAGISIRSLDRARRAMREAGEVQTVKSPGRSYWYIKRAGAPVAYEYGELVYAKRGDGHDE